MTEWSPQQASLSEHLLRMIECTRCNLAGQHYARKKDIQAPIEKKCQILQVKFLQVCLTSIKPIFASQEETIIWCMSCQTIVVTRSQLT